MQTDPKIPPTGQSSEELSSLEAQRVAERYDKRKRDIPVDRYSSFNLANLTQAQLRDFEIVRILRASGMVSLRDKDILEIGCGAGYYLRQFVQWGADPARIVGIDLLDERIHAARALCAPGMRLLCCDASHLPMPNGSFDLVMQYTAFSSILDRRVRELVAAEMLRVLRPGGLILSYDMCVNNPNNPDIRKVTRAELKALFPGVRYQSRRMNLVPPVARRIGGFSPMLIATLSKVAPFCSHLMFTSTRPS